MQRLEWQIQADDYWKVVLPVVVMGGPEAELGNSSGEDSGDEAEDERTVTAHDWLAALDLGDFASSQAQAQGGGLLVEGLRNAAFSACLQTQPCCEAVPHLAWTGGSDDHAVADVRSGTFTLEFTYIAESGSCFADGRGRADVSPGPERMPAPLSVSCRDQATGP